jgi:hypothetical protein
MIEINELEGYDLDKIIKLLNAEKKGEFEIAVPKSTVQFHSSSEAIAYDYLQGAYAGQILHDVSEEFNYDYVAPTDHISFEYTVKTTNIARLAEAILKLSYGYGNGSDDDNEEYDEDVSEFADQLESIKIACPDHIEIYEEFLAEAGESEDEEPEED